MNWEAYRRRRDDRPVHVATRILRAEKVRELPVNVERLLAWLEVRVERRTAPGWECALNSIVLPPTVWVNEDMPGTRQRFAMAHALGQLLLNPADGLVVADAHFSPGQDRDERDVNEFAASLLVPLWMLEPLVADRRLSTEEIATVFQVSVGVVGMQLEKLL